MSKGGFGGVAMRAAAALLGAALLVGLMPTSPSSVTTNWLLVVSTVLLGLAESTAASSDSIRVSLPLEYAVLVYVGVPVALVVGFAEVLLELALGRRTSIESLVDDLMSIVLACAVAGVITAQWWGTPGTVVAATAFFIARENSLIANGMRSLLLETRVIVMLVAAECSSGILLVILYPRLLFWGVMLVAIVLAIMKYSASLLNRVHHAYQSMLEATVAALEAGDSASEGHGVRVSMIASNVGRLLGYRGSTLETLRNAALLHELVLSESSAELEHVRYLADVVPVLRLLHGSDSECTQEQAEMAYVVYRAAGVDCSTVPSAARCLGDESRVARKLSKESLKKIDRLIHQSLVQEQ